MKIKTLTNLLAAIAVSAHLVSGSALADQGDCVAGGTLGGTYGKIAALVGVKMERINGKRLPAEETNGSLENIGVYDDRECNYFIVQDDALAMTKPTRVFAGFPIYQEPVLWVYNKEHDVDDFGDMEDQSKYVALVIKGSGAQTTMTMLQKEDDDYKDAGPLLVTSALRAGKLANQGGEVAVKINGKQVSRKVAGIFLVGNEIPADIIRYTGHKGNLAIGEAVDGDFDDAKNAFGAQLYSKCEVPRKTFPLGQRFEDLDTICVNASFVYDPLILSERKANKVEREIADIMLMLNQH